MNLEAVDCPQSPVNRLDGTQVMSMRLEKVCPQCDATLHVRKLACPCGHVFPAKAQQTKPKRPIEVMRMTSLVTFTSAPAILGGKKNCSALSAALTYGTVARPESSSAGADCL